MFDQNLFNQLLHAGNPTRWPAPAPTGGGNFNITTGIQAGPVWSPQQVQQGQQQLRNPYGGFPQGPRYGQMGGPVASTLGSQFSDLLSQGGQQNAMNFGRTASLANARQQLASQTAQGMAGTNWMNLLARQFDTELGTQSLRNNALTGLLSRFM